MAAFTLKLDTTTTRQAVLRLGRTMRKSIARAQNRSTGSAQTVLVQSIAQDLALQQAPIRKKLVVTKATPDRLSTQISVKGSPVPLIEFRARGPMPSRGRGRGVTAKLPTGAGRYPKAFLARMGTGHLGVFERHKGVGRLGIHELFGPSLPHVFRKYQAAALARYDEQMTKNLVSEFKFAIREAAAAAA